MYNSVKKRWFSESSKLEYSMNIYDFQQKKNNEKSMSTFIKKIEKHMKKKPKDEANKLKWEEDTIRIIKEFIKEDEVFGLKELEDKELELIIDMNREFISKAKEFDSNLGREEIFQALRNIWIVGVLQATLREEVYLKKSIFAYSMIYPYSDNFLDDKNISNKDKEIFNNKLYLMLKGENVFFENELEEKIYKLVKYVEEDYERSKFPKVYRSLIDIYNSQVKSIKQQGKICIPYENDILGISIQKGGTSVLADGYLIKGDLNKAELEFCMGYGALLQLIDDFEDLKEDKRNRYSTIMTQVSENYYLDVIINKLINYAYDLFNTTILFKNKEKLKNVMLSNCIIIIVCTVVLNKEFFSKDYIKDMEKYMPFTIDYIEKLSRELEKKLEKTEVLV